MLRPQGREGGEGSETADDDPDAANAQLYDDTVRRVFDQFGIEWKVTEERIIAVVSDGAGTMGAYVGLLNNIREKGGKELIGWVKDAAHCLMRAVMCMGLSLRVRTKTVRTRISSHRCSCQ